MGQAALDGFDTDPSIALEGLTVLVVDDERDSREMLACVLETRGACVHQAESTEAALAYLATSTPNVIISDIAMPIEDGYCLMRRVRALQHSDKRRLPVIALTALTRESDRLQALAAGFNLHLPKPLQMERLIRSVVEICQSITVNTGRTDRRHE